MSHPPIDGIEMEKALERLVNNYGLLVKVVKGLAAEMETGVPDVLKMLEDGNFDDAAKMCHRFKGVSSNISATELFAAITEAEAACKAMDAATAREKLEASLVMIQRSAASIPA